MYYGLILGAGILSFLLFYFGSKLSEKEHFPLRLIVFGVGMVLLIPLAKGVIDSGEVCELVPNVTQEVYVYGENYSGYHGDYGVTPPPNEVNLFHKNTTFTYSTVCHDTTESTTGVTVYKIISYTVILFIAYILFYFVYWLFANRMAKWVRKMQEFRRKR